MTKTGSLTSPITAWAERSLTLRYHDNKIPAKFPNLNTFFWKRRPFALSNNESKVWATILECKDSQESHACQFFRFFSRHIAGPLFFKIQKFCYHGNKTLRLFLSIVPCRKTTRGSYYLHGGTVWGLDIETQMSHAVLFRIKLRVRSIGKSGFRFSKSKSGFANRTRNPKTDFTSEKSVLRVDFN